MKRLFVLYDGECAFCQQCREWLSQQPAFVELRFIPMQSDEVTQRFPGVEKFGLGEDLLVISDEGAVYRGSSAWIMCFYALVEYREWAERLAHPTLLPLARYAFQLVSKQRLRLSRWLFRAEPEDVRKQLGSEPAVTCAPERLEKCRRAPRSGRSDASGIH